MSSISPQPAHGTANTFAGHWCSACQGQLTACPNGPSRSYLVPADDPLPELARIAAALERIAAALEALA